MDNSPTTTTWAQKMLMCLILASYTLGWFFRSGLASIADVLEADLNTTSSGVGLVSSGIYVTFVLFQIPAGFLTETYEAPVLAAISSLGLALGCFLFSISETLIVAVSVRIFSGIMLAPSWLACIAYAGQTFDNNTVTKLVGASQFIAAMSFLSISTIQAYIYETYQIWRPIFWILSILFLIVAILIAIVFIELQLSKQKQKQINNLIITSTDVEHINNTEMNTKKNINQTNTNIVEESPWKNIGRNASASLSRVRAISLKREHAQEDKTDNDDHKSNETLTTNTNTNTNNKKENNVVGLSQINTISEGNKYNEEDNDDDAGRTNIINETKTLQLTRYGYILNVIKIIICDVQNIVHGGFGFCLVSVQLGLNGLWFVSYLITKYNFSRSDATLVSGTSFFAFAVGATFLWPYVAIKFEEKYKNYQQYYFVVALLFTMCVEFILLIDWNKLFGNNNNNVENSYYYYCVIFGVCNAIAGCGVSGVANMSLFSRKRNLKYNERMGEIGTSYTYCLAISSVFVIQYAIGSLIDVHWESRNNREYDDQGIRHYIPSDYEFGFISVHSVLILAIILVAFIKSIS